MNNNQILLKLIFIALLQLSLLGCASMMPVGKLVFTGKDIKGDSGNGLIVIGSGDPQKKPYVMVGSPSNDIVFYLPYSTIYEFESSTGAPVFAKNNQYMATVNVGTASINTPKEFYDNLMNNMQNSGKCMIRNVEVINAPLNNRTILRYQLKMKESPEKNPQWNVWQWSYWVAIPHNSKWYSLHLSLLDQNENKLSSEDGKIIYVLSMFDPGFFSRKK